MTAMSAAGVPLPEAQIQVIHSALLWEQFRVSLHMFCCIMLTFPIELASQEEGPR